MVLLPPALAACSRAGRNKPALLDEYSSARGPPSGRAESSAGGTTRLIGFDRSRSTRRFTPAGFRCGCTQGHTQAGYRLTQRCWPRCESATAVPWLVWGASAVGIERARQLTRPLILSPDACSDSLCGDCRPIRAGGLVCLSEPAARHHGSLRRWPYLIVAPWASSSVGMR